MGSTVNENRFFLDDEEQVQPQEQVVTLDLSKKSLKKVPKQEDAQCVRVLILDDNELQKIDNIDSYLKIEKVCWLDFLIEHGIIL